MAHREAARMRSDGREVVEMWSANPGCSRWLSLSIVLAVTLALSCATKEETGKMLGGLLGGAGGAAGGYSAAKAGGASDGAAIALGIGAGLIGARAGMLIGGKIGSLLDEDEKRKASEATEKALETEPNETSGDAPVEWRSDSRRDVHGTSEVVRTEPSLSDGSTCKDVREVVYVGGEETEQMTRYCRASSGGRWERHA
jgi:surface antigen